MNRRVSELVAALPTAWLANYVAVYEAGRVQRQPEASFVNGSGECCLVGALAGAASAEAMVGSELWDRFLGSELEALSRRFESRRLTGPEFYVEVLLELAARSAPGLVPAEAVVI